jgi:death on curing protein
MFSIVKGHAFNDGNKRTALITVDVFTQVNGYELTAQSHEIAIKLVEIASNEIQLEQFTGWLRQRIR